MTDIRFYHLETQNIFEALPGLVRKAFNNGHKILVHTPDKDMLKKLDDHLWSFHPEVFLPHGRAGEKHDSDQPILLTDNFENSNQADLLISLGALEDETIGNYKLVCIMFDARDEDALKKARVEWKKLKENDEYNLTYWRQDEQAGWQEQKLA